jgi:acetoin utilization deacetylase AcuC-like enzyme
MPSVSIVKDERYLEHHPGDGHPESPNRLRVIHDLLDLEFSALPRIPARFATMDELALIHDPFYIQAVAATQGVAFTRLDPDTALSERSFEIALLAAGGLLRAADELLDPEPGPRPLASIFAFVRPPGHHAEPSRGMGFCLFNNVAVAAAYAKEKYGLKRILIIDWDLHHGNGTQRAFYEDPAVLYFSSHQHPYYPGSGSIADVGSGAGEGFTVNAPFPRGFGDAEYVRVYEAILKPIALEFRPELILVSAGFDPFVKDPLGGMKVTADGFGALTTIILDLARQTCGRLLFALEGGYNPEGLRSGVRSVLHTLLGQPLPLIQNEPLKEAHHVIQQIISVQRKYWKSLR